VITPAASKSQPGHRSDTAAASRARGQTKNSLPCGSQKKKKVKTPAGRAATRSMFAERRFSPHTARLTERAKRIHKITVTDSTNTFA